MAGIQLSGLSSGLDTESLISGLMQVEQAPRTRITLQQAAAHARQDGLRAIEDKLKSLKLASDDLGSILTWKLAQTATSSDTTKAATTLTGGAAPGIYSVNVTQLATNEQRAYGYVADSAADHTVTLNGNSLTIVAGSSVDTVAAQINGDTAYGASAVNVNGSLVVTSRTTGTAVTMTGTGGSPLTETSARLAKQAAYTIDGTSYTSPSNTISAASGATGIITGVDLKLTGSGSFTVNVTPPAVDTATVTSKVKAFVDAYNSALDLMKSKTGEKRVPNAKSASDAAKGALWGDSTVTSLMQTLRSTIGGFTQAGNPSALDALDELGISTGAASGDATFSQDAVNGKLTLDTTKLAAALDSDPNSVQRMLGGITGTNGFSQAFGATLTPYTQTAGVFDSRYDAAASDIKLFDDSLATLDARLTQKETQLRQMFTNLELSLQKIKSQGTEMLAKLGVSSTSS